jgi:hypothetical protein
MLSNLFFRTISILSYLARVCPTQFNSGQTDTWNFFTLYAYFFCLSIRLLILTHKTADKITGPEII